MFRDVGSFPGMADLVVIFFRSKEGEGEESERQSDEGSDDGGEDGVGGVAR